MAKLFTVFYNFLILLVLTGSRVESRINTDDLITSVEQEEPFEVPSKESIQTTILKTQKLLALQNAHPGLTSETPLNHICLEDSYLNFSSIYVSHNCVIFYKEPGCKGPLSQEQNSVVSIGKGNLPACVNGTNVTISTSPKPTDEPVASKSTKHEFLQFGAPTRSPDNLAVPSQGIESVSYEPKDYDLTDFPTEGEFEPWKPTKFPLDFTSVTNSTKYNSVLSKSSISVSSNGTLNVDFDDAEVTIFEFEASGRSQSWPRRNQTMKSKPSLPSPKSKPIAPPSLVGNDSERLDNKPDCLRKCDSMDKYGVRWEVCLGAVGFLPCPGDSEGRVFWNCGNTGYFEGAGPDFSQCRSRWVSAAESSLLATNTQKRTTGFRQVTHVMLERVEKRNDRQHPQYFGHEIPGIISLVGKVKDVVASNENGVSEAEALVTSSVIILDSVAAESVTWAQLPKRDRALTGTQLIHTMESTLFGLSRKCEKSGIHKYSKSFSRTPGFRVRLGSVKRLDEIDVDEVVEEQASFANTNDVDITMPRGWTSAVPHGELEEIHFVRISIKPEMVENLMPTNPISMYASKKVNGPLACFSVANTNCTAGAKVRFPGGRGIRITFPHEGEARGIEGATFVPRRLHADEKLTFVRGSSVCVYWDSDKLDWSTEGCHVASSGRYSTTCECNHLTSFAVLMDAHHYVGKSIWIVVLTRVLCTISSFLLLVTIILFKRLRSVRTPRSIVTLHLCCCLLVGNILILTLMDRDNFPISEGFCAFIGVATYFTYLAAFAWMGIEGYVVYKMVVDVFDSGTDNKIRLRLIGYGLPLGITLIFLTVHLSADSTVFGGETYCWLQGHYTWAFIVPVIAVCFMNLVVMVIALEKAFKKSNPALQAKYSARQCKTMIIGVISLTTILGLSWIFGFLLTVQNVTVATVGAYLFTIFSGSQGIFIFVFHCWMNKQIRNALQRRVLVWHSTVTSSDIHKSTGRAGHRKRSDDTSGVLGQTSGSEGTQKTVSTNLSTSVVKGTTPQVQSESVRMLPMDMDLDRQVHN